MLRIELRDLQRKVILNKKRLRELTKKAASKLMIAKGDLSVVFVGENRMRKLNFTYRHRNEPTDVLSFLLEEEPFFGEIIICPKVIIQKEKKDYLDEKDMEKKVFERIVHGLLHLCHFDHQTEVEAKVMEVEEKKLLKILTV